MTWFVSVLNVCIFSNTSRKKMSSSRKHHLKVKVETLEEWVVRPRGPLRFKEGREEPSVFSFCSSWLMLCACCRAEFDAVHRQRPPRGGGAAAGGGTAALHGQHVSSSLHAQNPAGAPGSGTRPHSVSTPAREPTCDQLLLLFQDLCREIHRKIEQTDEERYDLEMKVTKSNKEVRSWGTSQWFHQGKPRGVSVRVILSQTNISPLMTG